MRLDISPAALSRFISALMLKKLVICPIARTYLGCPYSQKAIVIGCTIPLDLWFLLNSKSKFEIADKFHKK
jgi:hypothetical protein